jgi:FMN phosphatase YigB (HAD superfamily)
MRDQNEILRREIKVLTFDQYGTIVDMQSGRFCEARAGTESRTTL